MAVFDTNFLIALESKEEGAVNWLREHRHEEHYVPDVVAIEYLTGHTSPDEALDALNSSFVIAHGNLEWVRVAADLRSRLRRRAAKFRTPDFWIAAWSVYVGMPVVSRDQAHFKSMGVDVVGW